MDFDSDFIGYDYLDSRDIEDRIEELTDSETGKWRQANCSMTIATSNLAALLIGLEHREKKI